MIYILNFLIKSAADMVGFVLGLLPASPFEWVVGPIQDLLGIWNYVLPIPEMIGEMEAFTAATAMWYVLRWLLRFVRYIG